MQSITKQFVIFTMLLFVLTGCGNDKMSELKRYVKKVKARKPPPIKPIPRFEQFEAYNYKVQEKRSPFEPKIIVPKATAESPDLKRKREELENFPLDSLSMVGVLMRGDKKWALVSAPDNKIHKVTVGMYMGKNYGQVVGIFENSIDLIETVTDRFGVWQKRDAKVVMK